MEIKILIFLISLVNQKEDEFHVSVCLIYLYYRLKEYMTYIT